MRCLNCGTIVADADPACLSCGAQCTTPVCEQEAGLPVPYLAGICLCVGLFGYPLLNRPDHPIHDREVIEEKKTIAYAWGLAGFFVGLMGDAFLWSRRRGKKPSGESQFQAPDAFTPPPGAQNPFRQGTAAATPAAADRLFQRATALSAATASPSATPTRKQPLRPAGQRQPPPKQRSGVVRAIFGVVWAVVFFFVAAVVSSTLTTSGAGDDPELRKQLAGQAGEKFGPLCLLGSIVLAAVLGSLGLLPGTRRNKP